MAPEGGSDCFSPGLAGTGISLFCAICRSTFGFADRAWLGGAQFVRVGLGHLQSGGLFSRLRSSTLRGIWDPGKEGSLHSGPSMAVEVDGKGTCRWRLFTGQAALPGPGRWLALFSEYDRRSCSGGFQARGLVLSHSAAQSSGRRRVVGVLGWTRAGGSE